MGSRGSRQLQGARGAVLPGSFHRSQSCISFWQHDPSHVPATCRLLNSLRKNPWIHIWPSAEKIGAAKSFVSYFPKPGGGDACQFLSSLWNPFGSKWLSLSFKSKTPRNLVSPHHFRGSSHNKRANVLTGRTQICKTTGAVKHDENRCPLGRTTGKAAGAPLCVAHGFAVWYFTNTSGRAASPGPQLWGASPAIPWKDEELGLGGAGKRRKEASPTWPYIFWFLSLLYYWLLPKWSFRSSAYSNRRKLNINNRLFPSRLLFVNKGCKWNKAGKIISTPWPWFSGTWRICTFPQPSLHPCPCGIHCCAEHGQGWKFVFCQGTPHTSLTLPGTFQI